ncbi:hypothetical protein EJB05_22774, partial [Eragrostis curvula]
MPLSLPLCGGKPSRSASAIVVDSARERHDLKIDAMSFAAGALATTGRRFVSSSAFTVGGHRWRIRYFPNGDRPDSAGHVSLFLALDEEDVAGEVETVAMLIGCPLARFGVHVMKAQEMVLSDSLMLALLDILLICKSA